MTAVFLVADDGVSEVLGMDTNLVLAACLQMEIHQGVAGVADEDLVMRHGEFSTVVNGAGIGDEGLVVLEPRLHGARAGFQLAFHHGHIATVINLFFPVFLKAHGDLFVLGEEHEAGGVAVETVDGMGAAALLGGGEILVEDALRGLLFLARTIGEQSLLFVDDHKVFVFIDNFQPFAVKAFLGGGFANLDRHARLQGEVELAGAFPIHADHAVGQPMFYLGAADAVHLFHDELHQWCCFGHLELKRVAF